MISSQESSKDTLRLLTSYPTITAASRTTRMNRGRLSFYGTVHKSSATETSISPSRRLSASAALQALREDPALFHPEEEAKHEVLPIVKVTKKRFSLRSTLPVPSSSKPDGSSSSPPKSPLMKDTTSETGSLVSTSASKPSPFNAAARRRSSRKSVNGMVIEIDFDDQSELTMFENCDDYVDDYKPILKREASNESLEELRTRLEALEHERKTQQLPEHDEYGLGQECMKKKLFEALESSSNTEQGASSLSLRGIPEFAQLAEGLEGGVAEEEEDQDEVVSVFSRLSQSHQSRRSTVRSSINGVVLEYDWSSGSESDEAASDNEC